MEKKLKMKKIRDMLSQKSNELNELIQVLEKTGIGLEIKIVKDLIDLGYKDTNIRYVQSSKQIGSKEASELQEIDGILTKEISLTDQTMFLPCQLDKLELQIILEVKGTNPSIDNDELILRGLPFNERNSYPLNLLPI